MKPLNIDKTGCSNTSSNCVVWQGPDIECINLCKGDSITEVVYKMALELCKLMDTFDLKNYDLKCFSTGVCQPQDFKDFINILINKVCLIQTCTNCGDACNPCPTPPSTPVIPGGDPNPIIPIDEAFYFYNDLGDQVTVLALTDYTTLIGHTVGNQIADIQALQASVVSLDARVTTLESTPAPTFTLPDVILPTGPTPLVTAVQTTAAELAQLTTATGTPDAIYTNIGKGNPAVGSSRSFSTGGLVSSLPGFSTSVTNQALAVGNMLVQLNDMAIGLRNLIDAYIPSICNAIDISMNVIYSNSALTLTFYFTGSPFSPDFVNTIPPGTVFTISDGFGNTATTTIDTIANQNNPSGTVFSIASTLLNPSATFTITGNAGYTSLSTGSQCQRLLNDTITNIAVCPALSLTPTATTIAFSFITDPATRTYTINLYTLASPIPISSQTVVSTVVQTIAASFIGLTSLTGYRVNIDVDISGIVTQCPLTTVTTL